MSANVVSDIQTRVRTFEICVLTHDALRMFIMVQILASQLHFLANRNTELTAIVLVTKLHKRMGGHAVSLSNPIGRLRSRVREIESDLIQVYPLRYLLFCAPRKQALTLIKILTEYSSA